ncbi:cyclin-dependent kinases regulatory subunit, partial [Haematococcus lacustris]
MADPCHAFRTLTLMVVTPMLHCSVAEHLCSQPSKPLLPSAGVSCKDNTSATAGTSCITTAIHLATGRRLSGVRAALDADSRSILPGQWHHAADPGDQDVAGHGEAAAHSPVAGQQQAQLAGLVPAVRRHRPGDVRRHVGRGLKEALGQRKVQAVLWQDARGGFVLGQGQQAGKEAVAGPHPSPGLWGSWLQRHWHHWLQGCPCQPDAEGGSEAAEWRGIGVQQSRGWVHYAVHRPEQHIMLFRRPKNYGQPQPGAPGMIQQGNEVQAQ